MYLIYNCLSILTTICIDNNFLRQQVKIWATRSKRTGLLYDIRAVQFQNQYLEAFLGGERQRRLSISTHAHARSHLNSETIRDRRRVKAYVHNL